MSYVSHDLLGETVYDPGTGMTGNPPWVWPFERSRKAKVRAVWVWYSKPRNYLMLTLANDEGRVESVIAEAVKMAPVANLSLVLADSQLPTRAKTVLRRTRCKTLGDLVKLGEEKLAKTDRCGATTLKQIQEFAREHGAPLEGEE